MLTSSSDSIQAENEYVKTAVYELINISKRVSVFSKYDVNNIPKDATTFKTWGEPVQSESKEVEKIIGGPGELVSESGNKGEPLHTIIYAYKDLGANANFLFQGNKLQNKAQIGLK
ncbi:hypothetical protein P4S95_18260 [Aneurinibacillus aneurinilyticus]|uniref:hypothetical protein n=1 Tax=Aneurinibacillus aneurinilyticus TaxID=1391 RepID=UPI002E1EDE24|nr:hypothetical protein [Aneurinibacillus aneurinilyticus]